MRGGTAHCTVVVSDEPIGSPLVRRPATAITLNLPSFEKYEPLIKPGGLLVYNRSLIDRQASRTDIRYVAVPANDIAEQLGNVRQANVVLLGAYLAASGILPLEAVATALDNHLPGRQRRFLESNKEALRRGAATRIADHASRRLQTATNLGNPQSPIRNLNKEARTWPHFGKAATPSAHSAWAARSFASC